MSHPIQLGPPFHHKWPMWSSIPRTKTSIRFGPHETAAGESLNVPPNFCHPLQSEPFHRLCHKELSVPFPKISSRFGAQEATAGPEVNVPPHPIGAAVPPQMADVVVHPSHEDVNTIWAPRDCRRGIFERAA